MRRIAIVLAVVLAASLTAFAERIVLVAGGTTEGGNVPATEAKLVAPFGIDFDKDGAAYLVELTGQRVLRIDAKGILHVIAGDGNKGDGGDGGPAAKAQFNGMHSLAIGGDGLVYLADTWNNRIRVIDPKNGTINAFAGTGKKGFGGDGGPALQAEFTGVFCIAFDAKKERMIVTDLDNRRIRAIDMKTKIVTTIAGNGQRGVPADGSDAKTSPLVDPRAAAIDSKSNVYILERGGHALRVVDASGKIRTVAGTGKGGYSGDGGDALKAQLNGPKHLCIDAEDNVIVADTENHVVRKVLPREGRIVLLAGAGKRGSGGLDGPPEKVGLSQPHGVTLHRDGTLYIVDSSNNRVLKVVR
jgi:DNA-binding beta-propeller fold protein YncE